MSESNYSKLTALGIPLKLGARGQVKTICPKCSHTRKPENRKEACLSVNVDTAAYSCHNCGFQGNANFIPNQKQYVKPRWSNVTALSDGHVQYWNSRGISQQTLIKARMTEGMEWMPYPGFEIWTMQWPYYRDGELVNVKFRGWVYLNELGADGQQLKKKTFKQITGAELIFWNLDAIKDSEECCIVEGEVDCMTYMEIGYQFAVSVPNGATESKKNNNLVYLDNCISYFENKKKIYIGVDNDEPGRALQRELIRRLGAERCWIIDYGDCKDANEYKVKYGAFALQALFASARPALIEGIVDVDDAWKEVLDIWENGLPPGALVNVKDVDEHISFPPGFFTVVTGKSNGGKALALDTLIPTPTGWTTMGEIKVGDVIYDESGKECNVVGATEVMFGRPCYEMEFRGGVKVVCDEQHLWFTNTAQAKQSAMTSKYKRARSKKSLPYNDQTHKRTFPSVKTTREIFETMTYSSFKNNHFIPPIKPVKGRKNALLIPPYTLGAWLGDGDSDCGRITDAEGFIVSEIEKDGFKAKYQQRYRYGIHGLSKYLRMLNVFKNKHIPKEYLRATYEDRLALLQGIMDTDGSITKDGKIEVSTVKENLANEYYELLSSFGIIATVMVVRASIKGKDCGLNYRIGFHTKIPVFRFPRKAGRMIIPKKGFERAIISCEKVKSVPVRCIKVDSPNNLFLCTKGFIPTHNSPMLRYFLVRLAVIHNLKIAFFSPEDEPIGLHITNIISLLTGKSFEHKFGHGNHIALAEVNQAKEFIKEHFFFISKGKPQEGQEFSLKNFTVEEILTLSKKLVFRHGINFLVIDPWNKIKHKKDGGHWDQKDYISDQLDLILNFSEVNGVHTFLVAHPTKIEKDKRDGKYPVVALGQISGAAEFETKPHMGISIYRDYEKERSSMYVLKMKHKHLGKIGFVHFKYAYLSGRYDVEGCVPDKGNWLKVAPLNQGYNEPSSVIGELPVIAATPGAEAEGMPF